MNLKIRSEIHQNISFFSIYGFEIVDKRNVLLQNGATCWCVYANQVILFVFQILIGSILMGLVQTRRIDCESI
jgi:hypothetical protein